jgi:hypothetical protein
MFTYCKNALVYYNAGEVGVLDSEKVGFGQVLGTNSVPELTKPDLSGAVQ